MPKKISKTEYEKKTPEKLKEYTFKDEKGHQITLYISGRYESVTMFCDKCNIAYQLTKKEVEELK